MPRAETARLEEAQRNFHLGNTFKAQGQLDEAIAHYERALALEPDNAKILNNLGLALASQGRTGQAIAHYERALALDPDYAAALNNLGLALAAEGNINRAIACYERALALRPDDALTHNNLGNAFKAQGKVDRAIACYEHALALDPDDAKAHHNLGSALALQGRIDLALAHYERACTLWPDNIASQQSRLLILNYTSDKDPRAVFTAHLDFAKRWEAPLAASIHPHANDRSCERRLRIGYVSCDFRQHSVGYFIEPVLSHHDHGPFEIFCYSNHLQEDAVSARLKSRADHWRRLVGLSDERVAHQIRQDQIDILVDLSGHMGGNRLLTFARKPAPIQVTWLGYPNTTGLSAVDYRLTDAFADPPGMTEHLHSEKLVRLLECFSCYRPPDDAPEVSALPAREKGYVTFGSFNNLAKITPEVIATWARILQSLSGSRLTLKNPALSGNATQQRIRKIFMDSGIASERVDLFGHDPSSRLHLERYRSIDVALDTFPYNGATTTCEALWMGVPVVTLAGGTHAGRVGVSQLSNLGLTELVGATPAEYIAVALRWATDLERLGALRAELRARMAASPLMQAQRFTKNLEQAYRLMWQDWCFKALGNRIVRR